MAAFLLTFYTNILTKFMQRNTCTTVVLRKSRTLVHVQANVVSTSGTTWWPWGSCVMVQWEWLWGSRVYPNPVSLRAATGHVWRGTWFSGGLWMHWGVTTYIICMLFYTTSSKCDAWATTCLFAVLLTVSIGKCR